MYDDLGKICKGDAQKLNIHLPTTTHKTLQYKHIMSSSPTEIIIDVHNNDIIGGRGSLPLRHPGNISYRKIVNSNKQAYIKCMKNDKLRLSRSIVAAIRETGGRFLERVSPYNKDEDGTPVAYRDIGDRRAIEKTSQALREGQPKLKRMIMAAENEKKAASPLPLSSPSLLNTNLNIPAATATTPFANLSTEHLLRLALSNVQSRSSNLVEVERVSPPPLARNVTEEQHLPLPLPSSLPSYMQSLDADLLLIHLLRRANRSEQSILL